MAVINEDDNAWGFHREGASIEAHAEELPATHRSASRLEARIAVVLGLLLPGLPLAGLVLFDWDRPPALASVPVFPSGAIDPSASAAPHADAPISPASADESASTPPARTTVAKAIPAKPRELAMAPPAPEWLRGLVNEVRQSFSSPWTGRQPPPSSMPEPGGHR